MKPWYYSWQFLSLLLAVAIYIPIYIHGIELHKEAFSYCLMILGLTILEPQARGLGHYNPLMFYDSNIYTKARPNIAMTIIGTITVFWALWIIFNLEESALMPNF